MKENGSLIGGIAMSDKPLPVGVDNFEMLVTRGYYFIDKTLLIKDLMDKKGLSTFLPVRGASERR